MIVEKHHIIPFHEWKRRINPNVTRHDRDFNASDNIVFLTLEQHAIAHRWLWEQYGSVEDKLAYQIKAGLIGKDELIKLQCSHNGMKGIGRKQSEETKMKRRLLMLGNSLSKGRKQTKEHIEKRISLLRGKEQPLERRLRISQSLFGRSRGPESLGTRRKKSLALKGRIIGPQRRNKISGRYE